MYQYEESIGDGWKHLLIPIKHYCDKHGIVILQIKEKFGGLRVYTDTMDEKLDELIRQAEETASHTCQDCGEEGKLVSPNGWMLTLCEKHELERKRK